MLMANTLMQQPSRSWPHVILPVKAEQKPLYRSFIMGMAIFSPTVSRPPMLTLLMAPLQDLFALFGSSHCKPLPAIDRATGTRCNATRAPSRGTTRAMDKASWRATSLPASAAAIGDTEKNVAPTAPSRLRVVRAFDPGVAPSCAGRMVISGRMADVCAELDRMTQKEASTRQR